MDMETNMQNYQTSDISLAAYLFSSGTNLLDIDRVNPRRAVFIFERPKSEILSKWQEGRAMVNALAFYNAYQALKAKIFRDD